MAINTLSHTPPLAAGRPAAAAAGSKKTFSISFKSNLKQERKSKEDNYTLSSSALHTAEALASRLGLDLTIAGLERLFLQPGSDPPDFTRSDGPRRPIRVAYQGVRGSYCHEAATSSFPYTVDAFPAGNNMEEAFSALESGSADRAIVPAENSLDGPIDRNLDLLLRHPAVRITGELVVPVNHCLLAAPGVEISDLRRIVSHPQALGHCDRRIRSLDLEVEEVGDAAEAAQAVAEERIRDTAVIGSRIAAREFGLRVMEQGFHDEGGNYNRFLQLGVGGGGGFCGGGNWKTTVAFSLEKGVSGLFRAMWIFESRGVRVRRVDHRPDRVRPVRFVRRVGGGEVVRMEYVFVVDVEGRETDGSVAAAVAALDEISGHVRVLGSYACTCGD